MNISDQREFYIARVLQLLSTFDNLNVSHFEYLMLAAALIDSGRVGEAVRFYRLAYAFAPTDFDRAMARRVYGRALIALGKFDEGRSEMQSAKDLFVMLTSNPSYEKDRLLGEAAETTRRLVQISLQRGFRDFLTKDLSDFRSDTDKISDPVRKKVYQDALAIVEKRVSEPAI